jgi:ABC-type dipeptide/oligopeptide/nickel transport system ATPase component
LTGETSAGCAFAARCTLVQDTCHVAPPPLVDVAAGRRAACPVVNGSAATSQELSA